MWQTDAKLLTWTTRSKKCFYDPVKLHQSIAFRNKPTFHPSLRTNDLPPPPQMVNNMFKDMVQKRWKKKSAKMFQKKSEEIVQK